MSNSKSQKNFKEEVYKVVKGVPRGKVITYGEVARLVGKPFWARQVGWVLHQNRDNNTPCHRVVDRNGRLAPNFAFDGAAEQRRRLLLEKISFRDDMHVSLDKSLWTS